MATTEAEIIDTAAPELRILPIAQLRESPLNPRKHFDERKLLELADSIRQVGVLQPLVARPLPGAEDAYEIAAGHRRFRAAQLADQATAPVFVRAMSDPAFLELLTFENLLREDLTALEEAQSFAVLMHGGDYDVPKIAAKIGRSIKYVYDRLKLLQLIPTAKKLLEDGVITAGHGILLARLSKADQERALDVSRYGTGGVFQRESISEEYFPGDPELQLDDPKKARSVRELQQWIDENVRFVPEKIQQEDLAFDLPKTARLLATANGKNKVVKITRAYRVPDAARDTSERTIGYNGWRRADGEPEPFENGFPADKAKPSKPCEHARIGLIVAGPGRGEAFLVCIAKDRCQVHWAKEIRDRAKRAAERAKTNGGADGSAASRKTARDEQFPPKALRDEWLHEELMARVPTTVQAVMGVIAELGDLSDEICWNVAGQLGYLDGWQKVGRDDWSWSESSDTTDALQELLLPELPGKFKGERFQDGPAARTWLALRIWFARDFKGLGGEIELAVERRWKAHRKAEAQGGGEVVQTSAPKNRGSKKAKRTAKGAR